MSSGRDSGRVVLTDDEQILLRGCRDGDNAAWLSLYRTYAGDVGGFLKGMLRHSNDIDDLVQKVFLTFVSTLDRYRGEASLRTWLLRIARNLALHEIRSQHRRDRHLRAYAESVAGRRSPCTLSRVEARDELDRIQRLLGGLDERFREVWVLREIGSCSVSEAAVVLDVPEATVRTRHYRAKKRLMALLEAADAPVQPGRHSAESLTLVKGGGES